VSPLGGGAVAAYGLNYQYLATLDYFLRFLRANPELIPRSTLVIEPLLVKEDGDGDDIVDFAIEVTADDERVLWHTEPGALLFMVTEQFNPTVPTP
jgi:hypothetical protein